MTPSRRVETYLAQLGRELSQRGPLDARVVDEARGHLMDAIETGLDRGLSADAAEDEAFARFGSPGVVAASFMPKGLRLLNGIVVVACSLTILATTYLSLSIIVLHPPRVSYQTWFPVAAFFVTQSVLTLAVVSGRARGRVIRAFLLAGSILSVFTGVWWVRETVSAAHFEGYALVLGSWVAVQGALTLLRLAQWRQTMIPSQF